MQDLKVFDFNGANVRTVMVNDEPYFVGKDVAEILGYKNPSRLGLYELLKANGILPLIERGDD